MSWWAQWGPWIQAAAGAAAGYVDSKDKKKQAQNPGPWSQDSQLQPWEQSSGWLQEALNKFGSAWQGHTPSYFNRKPPGGGPSRATSDLLNQLQSGSLFSEGFGGDMRDAMSRYANQGTGMVNETFNRASGYRTDYLDDFIQGSGSLAESPYLHQFIQSRLFGGGNQGTILDDPTRLNQLLGSINMGGGGGGGGFDANLGEPTNDWMRKTLDGYWLDQENPHLKGVIEDIRQQGLQTYRDSVVPQIDARFGRSGRFGSHAYAVAQAEANERANRGIGADVSRVLAGNYEGERGRMSDTLNMLNQLDQTKVGAAASASAAASGANASMQSSLLRGIIDMEIAKMGDARAGERTLLDSILGHNDDRLGAGRLQFDSIMGLRDADLDALNLMGNMGITDAGTRLGAIGHGNTSVGQQKDLLNSVLTGRFGADASRNAGAMNRYQADKAEHDYYRDYDMNHAGQGLDVFSKISALFGNQKSSGVGPPAAFQNPWVGALMGGAGGYNMGKGSSGKGGSQQGNQFTGQGGAGAKVGVG